MTHRLKNYDYSSAGVYFVTICCKNKEHLFGKMVDGKLQKNKLSQICLKYWESLPNYYENCRLDEFVIMPNHVHGIIFLQSEMPVATIHELSLQAEKQSSVKRRQMILPKIVGRFKMQTAKQINELRNTQGQPFWQSNYHDRIIRNEDELNRIREYIILNPERWDKDKNNKGIFI